MGENSAISWTKNTFNPWWGCVKVSSGCTMCYAEELSNRFTDGVWGKDAPRRFFGDKHWNEPLRWNKKAGAAGERHNVFCGSMCDIMEDRDDLIEHRNRLFSLIEKTHNLNWLLLTKRPDGYMKFLPEEWMKNPRFNVWVMTTVESGDTIDRVNHLMKVPSVVRGLSVEPMLNYFDLRFDEWEGKINWVIIGGESGRNARPFDPDWARKMIEVCRKWKVPVFIKQMGDNPIGRRFKAKGGGDWNEWDPDLRVREFPLIEKRKEVFM